MHARFSSSLSFYVQLSYCRLKLGYISAFLEPDRSVVGETRKIKRVQRFSTHFPVSNLEFNYISKSGFFPRLKRTGPVIFRPE